MVKSFRLGEIPPKGGMTEWTMVPVLKTGVGQPTGGSNPSPSAKWGGARVADWARLLSECWGINSAAGSNPALPAKSRKLSEPESFFVSTSNG